MNRRSLILLMFLVASSFAGCGSIKQSRIEAFVNAEQQNLPRMLFSGLQAIGVEAGENELIYICRGQGIDDETLMKSKSRIDSEIEGFVKRKKKQFQSLIDYKVKLTVVVQSSADTEKELHRVSINPWEH